MNEKTKSQSSSGKQGIKNLQELSEWDKILLDGMDNDCKDLHEIIANERAKRKENQEKTTLPVSEWTQNLLDDMDNGFKWYPAIKEKRLQAEKRAKEQQEK